MKDSAPGRLHSSESRSLSSRHRRLDRGVHRVGREFVFGVCGGSDVVCFSEVGDARIMASAWLARKHFAIAGDIDLSLSLSRSTSRELSGLFLCRELSSSCSSSCALFSPYSFADCRLDPGADVRCRQSMSVNQSSLTFFPFSLLFS